jgi:inorganic pyrophosphatase
MLNNIIYFLNHYKDNDGDKFIQVGKVYDKEKAIQFIDKCKT